MLFFTEKNIPLVVKSFLFSNHAQGNIHNFFPGFWIFTFFPIKINFSTFFVKNWNLKSGLYFAFARISINGMNFFNKKPENSRKKIKIQKIEKKVLDVALVMIWKKENFYHQKNILLCEKKQILNLIDWSIIFRGFCPFILK